MIKIFFFQKNPATCLSDELMSLVSETSPFIKSVKSITALTILRILLFLDSSCNATVFVTISVNELKLIANCIKERKNRNRRSFDWILEPKNQWSKQLNMNEKSFSFRSVSFTLREVCNNANLMNHLYNILVLWIRATLPEIVEKVSYYHHGCTIVFAIT